MAKRTCGVPLCERPHKGHGLCDTHLYRKRHGLPLVAEPLRGSRKGATCAIEECSREIAGKGLCSLHWQRQRAGIPLDAPLQAANAGRVCSIDDCANPARRRGWCPKHYARWQTHGDPHIVQSRKADGACMIAGCERPLYAVGMCHFHRRRLLVGTPLEQPLKTAPGTPCSRRDCEIVAQHRGLCRRHRQQQDYLDNPIPFRAKTARRRYLAAKGMTDFDKEISEAYREAIASDPCAYCGSDCSDGHVDHRFPLSKGGTDRWWNLTKACSPCNLTKYNRCSTWFILLGRERS